MFHMGHIWLAVRSSSLPPTFKAIYHILAAIPAVVYVETAVQHELLSL